MKYGYDNNGNRKWAYDKATALNTSFSNDYENRMTGRGTCTYTYAPKRGADVICLFRADVLPL